MLHADNAYFIPAVSITGKAWKTNFPSNTAFRGFGGPQGMAVIENAIDRIARMLGKDATDIRLLNFYQPEHNNLTPYGQEIENNRLFLMYDKLMKSSGYTERRTEIEKFNADNEFYKKGLAMMPVKFGISFTSSFLNQAGALVNIYTDGTVLVNHGGTEMGQGLHTKMQQIAATELGISADRIKVNATNTSKVPNTSPTAASSGSDINGMAVKNAIDKIKAGLKELAEKENLPAGTPFPELCRLAHLNQVSLSATGYYKTPGIFFDRESGQGKPFYYFSYGMAVSEVMIDTLTGQCSLLRTDIVQDAGD